jgi:hypothetical protein
MPEGKPAGGRRTARRWLLAAAVAAVAVTAAVGIPVLGRGSSSGARGPSVIATPSDEHLLIVGPRDIDRDATEAARAALATGRIPELGPSPTDAERDQVRRAVETAVPRAAPAARQRAANVLAHATPAVRTALVERRQSIFRLRVLDTVAEDGDVVWLSLDGVPFGALELSNAGAELSIALPMGTTAHLLVVAERDGGGGVTFGAISSLGEIRTRVMNVGEREEWTVAVR